MADVAWLNDAGLGDDRDVMLRHYAEQYELLKKQRNELESEIVKCGSEISKSEGPGDDPGNRAAQSGIAGLRDRSHRDFDTVGMIRGYIGANPPVRQSGGTGFVDGSACRATHA